MHTKDPIPAAEHVARWLVELAAGDADIDQAPMTLMRLHKLL